jgi:hypothetical protein
LPRTCTGLENQFIKFLKLEEELDVGDVSPGCTDRKGGKEGVNGWTFKTL